MLRAAIWLAALVIVAASPQFIIRVDPPIIAVLTPNTGAVASTVVMTGQHFGPAQENTTLKLNGVAVTATIWSDTSITFTVPSTTTGSVVMVRGGLTSNALTFSVTSSSNPIVAGRLSGGTATLPNPTWASAGATIPTRTTICTTLSPGATPVQINAAIQSCGSNQVVKLNPGTYTLNDGLTSDGKNNVTLRGSGADSTFLIFSTSDDPCQGKGAVVCVDGNGLSYYALGPPTNIVNWTAGLSQGSTQLTLSSVPGLSVGMYIMVDQLNDTTNITGILVCQTISVCTDESGSGNTRTSRAQRQFVKVTNIAGNVVTITPPIDMPNWSAAKTPQAWWGTSTALSTGFGLENLSIDVAATGSRCVTFIMTTDSWMSGVRCLNAANGIGQESHVHIFQSAHVTVKDSYLYGSTSFAGGSQTYGIEVFGACNVLIQNNIVQHRTSPFVRDGDCGSVLAYNYTFDDYYPTSPLFLQGDYYSHEGGNAMNLTEGNEGLQIKNDIVHATSNLFTNVRNYVNGKVGTSPCAEGTNCETGAVKLYGRSRYMNFVGNILGTSGFHTQYEWNVSGTGGNISIWNLGSGSSNSPSDTEVKATLMRWGNYDVVTGAAVFNSAEVPTAISVLPNPLPGSNTYPNSYYLSAKPSWWTTATPWPAIGADVTGGDVSGVGGHVYKNPAHQCWDASSADTNYPVDASGLRPIHFACTYPLS